MQRWLSKEKERESQQPVVLDCLEQFRRALEPIHVVEKKKERA